METYIYIMLALGPPAFVCWHNWIYRWAIFDGTDTTFWDRVGRDIAVSLPGTRGDTYRYNELRAWIQKYAKMEHAHSDHVSVSVAGVNERFRNIVCDKRYLQYENNFLPRKWQIWVMMLLSFVWPLVLLGYAVLFIIQVVWFVVIEPLTH